MFAHNENIHAKIEEISKSLAPLIARLEDEMRWARSEEEISELRANKARREDALQLVNKILSHLPPCLELDLIEFKGREKQYEIKKLRYEFENFAKPGFLSQLCEIEENKIALKKMGLDDKAIDFMHKEGFIPVFSAFHDRSFRYDITVEHMHDLKYGGENKSDNFCLLPNHLNALKESFLRAQSTLLPTDNTSILIFRPKAVEGRVPDVPIIPGGFLVRNTSCAVMQSRVEELFGTKIDFTPP